MDISLIGLPAPLFAAAVAIAFLAGLVKGAVGFALPMILISGLSSFLPAETALAALLLPTLASNVYQVLRHGARAAWGTIRRYRVFMVVGLVFLMLSAQLYAFLSDRVLFLLLGGVIVLFSLSMLAGWQLHIAPAHRRRAELISGAVAGLVGGVSGVWGPPTVAFLTALNTEKGEQMRAQGVIFGLGAVVLLAAHVGSGVFNRDTAPLSLALLLPAGAGMVLGARLHDRLNARLFRRVTLAVLLVAGLNLIRRAFLG